MTTQDCVPSFIMESILISTPYRLYRLVTHYTLGRTNFGVVPNYSFEVTCGFVTTTSAFATRTCDA